MKILGIRINNLSKKEILEKIGFFLDDNHFHQIATINPEFILAAQKDVEFKKILNGADLNIADGIGVWYAFLRFGKWLKTRIAGADLMQIILQKADEKKLSVFLAINKNGLSSYEEISTVLSKMYPNIEFGGANLDPFDSGYKLEAKSYKLFFCNFGAPGQEKFINFTKNDTIGLAMGVGGSFDYITKKIKRAPKIMRILGLEWFWRLIFQSKRWKRIGNAVFVFPIKIIFSKKHNE